MRKILFYSLLCVMFSFETKASIIGMKDVEGKTKQITVENDWTVRQLLHAYEKGRESKMGYIIVVAQRINTPGDLDNNAKTALRGINTTHYVKHRNTITFSMDVVDDLLSDQLTTSDSRKMSVNPDFPVIELYRSLENDVGKKGKIKIYPNNVTIPNNVDDKKLISDALSPNSHIFYITEDALRNAFTALYREHSNPAQQVKIFQRIMNMGGDSHPWYDNAARMMGVVPRDKSSIQESVLNGDSVEEIVPPSQPQPVLHAVEKSPPLPQSVASNSSPVIQQMSPEELDSSFTEIANMINDGEMDIAKRLFEQVEGRGGKNHDWYKNILYTLYPEKKPTGYSNSAILQENPYPMPVQQNRPIVNEKPQPMAVQPDPAYTSRIRREIQNHSAEIIGELSSGGEALE